MEWSVVRTRRHATNAAVVAVMLLAFQLWWGVVDPLFVAVVAVLYFCFMCGFDVVRAQVSGSNG